ncbi:hypothetical protein [Halobacillus seohaensis]|uniref:Voltage-gated potassium channel n=1 Tax=Halobacillus seohaensis TaxID=447421 RepID=A0ABW2ELX7_9BACI
MALKKATKTVYELLMIALATLAVATIWKETQYDSYIVWITWSIFFIDFLYRLFNSSNKWTFIKRNPFIVIAAVPLDAVFQFARFARILHLLRLKSITKYYTKPFIHFLQKQQLSYVAGVTMVLIFILIIPLKNVEANLENYYQAFLSLLTTLIFFGKTAFEPETGIGQIIVVVFTITGVILHGLIISTVLDYLIKTTFIQKIINKWKRQKNGENKEWQKKESQ